MQEFHDYKIVETLYDGHDVLVFRGEHKTDHALHIIKALLSGRPEQVAAFRHEYQINHNLKMQGLVHCQQLIEKGDKRLLVFDYVEGISLKEYLGGQPVSLDKFFPIAIGIVGCLEELHGHKVIHKDIKPANILINPETLAIKLFDLSIATQLANETHEAVSVDKLEGSLAYIAPEQTGRMNRPMDYRSDYYALGFTFFEMLTGELPFVCEDALGYVHAHMARMPKPVSILNPNVPEMLSKVVAKLVSKQAEDRYQSTEGLRADLERCFQEWSKTKTISEFPLGAHEAYYKLVVSPKIFGRDQEIATLMTTFERVARGSSECLLISGHSGIGKSRLVNEVQWPIIRKRGYFVRGKFDLLQRATPYTAFVEAFTNLFKHWLCESEAKFQQRRERLNKAMGQYGQVIVEFFPYLEKVMGKQPEIDKLPPDQAQNRFLYHFQKFIECISSPEEPVVMFMDDLQWIDQGSLRLLEIMLTTQDVRSLLFIGAYRDNEVDETHPFIKLMDRLRKVNGSVKDIVLKPLKLLHTQEFLSDSLRMEGESVLPLAEVVFEKTAGNPFFSLEFLKECFAQKHLTYDHKGCLWNWDLEKISSMAGTDNVIDLVLAKIAHLPKESQKLLQIGSCLGTNFDNCSLRHIRKSDEIKILEAISPILEAGMIQRVDQGLRYKFIHDRIQQAAYQTLSDEEKEQLHLAIGRMLLGKMDRLQTKDELFEVLDHFRLCPGLISEEREKLRLADLSLQAGRQAIDAGAYQAADGYLLFGLDLTRETSWDEQHQLLMDLNMTFLGSLSLQNRLQEALDLSFELLGKCVSSIEKVRLYARQMKLAMIMKDFGLVMSAFDNAFLLLGRKKLPKKVSKMAAILKNFRMQFKYGRGETFLQNVLKIRRVDTEMDRLAYEITYLAGFSFLVTKNYGAHFMLVCSELEYLFAHGAFKNYICLLIGASGIDQYKLGGSLSTYEIHYRGAIDFLESDEFSSSDKPIMRFSTNGSAGNFCNFQEIIDIEDKLIQDLVETGIFAFLGPTINRNFSQYYLSDVPLTKLAERARSHLKLGTKIQMQDIIELSNFALLSCQYLQQQCDASAKERLDSSPMKHIDVSLFHIFNSYFAEDYVMANNMLDVSKGEFVTVFALPRLFYRAIAILIYARLYPEATAADRNKYLKNIQMYLKQLKEASDHKPENYRHIYLISLAELARIKGSKKKAIKFYQEAIAAAKEQDYIRWVAIANERAGELYLEMGEGTIASVYIHEAIYYYQHWGCMLKVKRLNRKYSELLIDKHLRKDPKDLKPGETGTSGEGELDLTAMLKASQAISSEIQLDKLLPRILQVVVESSGADKAAFIGWKKDGWVIESVTEHKGDELTSTPMAEILMPESDLPEEFISGAIRARELEVISDMSQSGKYEALPYVRQYHTKSALCLPIVRDGKALAALYLENQMTADTFTPERVQLLKALSAQIAISLENARYFEHTQELFRSTERFVPKKFLELLGRNNIEEVAKGDNAKLEMSAIFADLRDFTTISESIEPEQLTYILNTYLKYMSPIIRNNHGFVNRVLGDGILALFPNDPKDAVQASIEMLQALELFNQEINAAGFESIKMGIGVNTGPAMLCALGEEERIEANVVSDMVNAASRIEGLNKLYGTKLLISDLTYNKLKDPSMFSIRQVDTVRVKGKTKSLGLYEVLPKAEDESYFYGFQKALTLYTAGKFKAANQNFAKCLTLRPNDSVAQLYADRCKAYQDNAPDNWDGVTTMLEK